ncbi:MAG: creatininase family protein [Halolamina sp.]
MEMLTEHTTTTAADALEEAEVALLPTGSVEQHGPALPLSTDFTAAEAVARGADTDAVVLPTVPVGVSSHHRQFDGTLWTEPETFEHYVADIAASVASHGVRKVVVVNGHGGNSAALQRAARRLREDEVAFVAPWNWFDALEGLDEELFDTPIGHADAIETSMVLHVAEHLVRPEALEQAEAGASDSWGKSVHGANVGFDTVDFSESGAVGEPTAGSAEAGEALFEQATGELAALVDWLADQPFADLTPKPHR